MSFSSILNIPEIAQNQNNKYITHNNAISYLEQASNARLLKTVAGVADVTLTAAECTRYRYYKLSGGSGNHNLVFLGEIDLLAVNNANREVIVENATIYVTTIKSDAAGTTVTLQAGQKALVRQDHDDFTLILLYAGSTVPYDIGVSITGLPDDNVEVMKFVAVRTIDFADDFGGSRGHVGVNPTATSIFSVSKNGSAIGTISISTSGVFTFVTTGAGVNLVAGDRIAIQSPTPQDATLANVAIILFGTRTV